MLETSPLLGGGHRWNNNRLNRLSFNNNINGGGRNKQRRQSSLKFLFFLTILSAIVTYFYDENLSSYNNIEEQQSSRVGSSINPDTLRAASVGSVVDETHGYILSNEQRELARTLNVEKRVSIVYIVADDCLALDMSNTVLPCPLNYSTNDSLIIYKNRFYN